MNKLNTINNHVTRLNGFLPFNFDVNFAELFFENAELDSEFHIDTMAFKTLKEATFDLELGTIILTGNAGHGKTHVCALLLSEIGGFTLSEAQTFLSSQDSHTKKVKYANNSNLRIIKDLSDFSLSPASNILLESTTDDATKTIICANDGHLRKAVEEAGLTTIIDLLDESVRSGQMVSPDGSVALINLNHQSVVAGEGRQSILSQVFSHWVHKEERWAICGQCPSMESCPIFYNRELLAETEGEEGSRFKAIKALLEIVEQSGHLITIRELLLYISYLMTGGLSCGEVHKKVEDSESDNTWQWDYLFHQTAFGDKLSSDELRRHPSFSGIRKVDPGYRSIREKDERIGSNERLGKFPPQNLTPEESDPKTSKEKRKAAATHTNRWREIRRRQFFESQSGISSETHVDLGRQVGLGNIESFKALISGTISKQERRRVRDTIIKGLESLQGIHRSGERGDLYIANQAFLRSTDTTVVGGKVPLSRIQLLPLSEVWRWRNRTSKGATICDSIDWIERSLILSLNGDNLDTGSCIELKIHEFELLMTTANGLRSEQFFAPEIRRLLNQLGKFTDADTEASQLTVFSGLSRHDLILDGETIIRAG
jgi:hypothetical protein